MKILKNLLVLFIITMLMIAMVPASPVQASAPFIRVSTIDQTLSLADTFGNPCGFMIADHLYGTMREEFFFDQAGQVTRLNAIWGQLKETWSANGKSLNVQVSGPILFTVLSDPEFYIMSVTGTSALITVPGFGTVYGSAGKTSTLWKFGSPNTMIGVVKEVGSPSIPNWEAICAYLAN